MPQREELWLRGQRERWMRPDADLWMRPDAARFLIPGSDPADVFSALARKHSPSQPRVPAGDPRGGRWTDHSGGQGQGAGLALPMGNVDVGDLSGSSEPGDLFSIAPEDSNIDNVQLAGDGNSVDMLEERDLGGHTIERHVGKSNETLSNDVREGQRYMRETGTSQDLRSGSFSSLQSANKLVNSTLSENAGKVDRVTSGAEPKARIDQQFESVTGYEAYARNERSQVVLRTTYGVRVIVVRDGVSAKGYRVDTAFQ